MALTAWIHSEAALRGLAVRPNSCSIACSHPELVLRSFDQPQHGVLQALHRRFGDRGPVDTTPVHSTALPLLQPVALNSGATVVQRRFPGQGHGSCCGSNDFRVAWWSGKAKRILQLDLLRVTAITDTIFVFCLDSELVGAVQVQLVDLEEQQRGVNSFMCNDNLLFIHQ